MNKLQKAMEATDAAADEVKVLGRPLTETRLMMVPTPRYSSERFSHLMEDAFDQILSLSKLKGGEYSGDDDRLANFRRNAAALALTQEQVWAVYAAKHWDAIMQFVKDQQTGVNRERSEPIEGRVFDLIVYLLLFRAMLEERHDAITRALHP